MKKPNLFLVGHPRTGTSSMHDYLSQHPDIFMSPIKEPNYFTKDFHAESDLLHKKAKFFHFREEAQYLKMVRLDSNLLPANQLLFIYILK